MTEVFAEFGRQSLGWFWLPVLTWTLGGGLVLGVLSRLRNLHPLVGYRLRQATFLARPVSVIAARWTPRLARVRRGQG